MTTNNPIITVDGPAGSGKGTVSNAIAQKFNFHLLDSGAIYRLTAFAIHQTNIRHHDHPALIELINSLSIKFQPCSQYGTAILLNDKNVTRAIRTEKCAADASKIAAIPQVRAALLTRQQNFNRPPGLVADGRDMGTIVFPNASSKLFLTASAQTRATRRQIQLNNQGNNATLESLIKDIKERDKRDIERTIAPLKPANDAHIIDTDNMSVNEVIEQAMALIKLSI